MHIVLKTDNLACLYKIPSYYHVNVQNVQYGLMRVCVKFGAN